jgi:hypothetical protein
MRKYISWLILFALLLFLWIGAKAEIGLAKDSIAILILLAILLLSSPLIIWALTLWGVISYTEKKQAKETALQLEEAVKKGHISRETAELAKIFTK